MKIKLDENLPEELIELFAAEDHDVHTVSTEGSSAKSIRQSSPQLAMKIASSSPKIWISQMCENSGPGRTPESCSFDYAIPAGGG